MFSTVRCCLEWQRVQPEQPHRVDIHQPPLSLDRGLNCFQIFSLLYATISFAFQRSMCSFIFILFQCACEASSEKGKTLSTFKIFTLLLIIAINIRFCTIAFICLQKTLFVYLSLSLLPSPLFQKGGGAKNVSYRTNVQLFEFKNRKQNIIFVCSFPHVLKLAW